MGGGGLAGVFGAYSKTPMEKAIRVAVEEAIRLIVAKTPPEYYRASTTPQPKVTPVTPPPSQAAPVPSTPATQPQPSLKASGPEPRIVYVKWPMASLREGPGTNFKILVEVKKGTTLAIKDDKAQWLRVSLEDGREGWIGRATVSETP